MDRFCALRLSAVVLALALLFIPPAADADEGTVKGGDYGRVWQPSWSALNERLFVLNPSLALAAALAGFSVIGLCAVMQGLYALVSPAPGMKKSAAAKRKAQRAKAPVMRSRRRGLGLSLKLVIFTIMLVLVVIIIMLSAPLMMIRTQQEIPLKTILIIALIALADGIVGAVVISLLLLSPLRKMIRQAELTRNTEGDSQGKHNAGSE
jgi:hypothetical protein